MEDSYAMIIKRATFVFTPHIAKRELGASAATKKYADSMFAPTELKKPSSD